MFQAKRTEPVGSKQPNGLGFYDMSGNVYEWVEDCWNEDYINAPRDGSAWINNEYPHYPPNCFQRGIRGGSWSNDPKYLRATYRNMESRYYSGYLIYRFPSCPGPSLTLCALSFDSLHQTPSGELVSKSVASSG